MTSLPIAELGLLSDCQRAMLVSSVGAIEWGCAPRFDSPSVFARLLDPDGGHWSIAPTAAYRATRRYLPDTLVHEITFDTPGGRLVLTDALAVGGELADPDGTSPGCLLRRLHVVSGEVEVAIDFQPRPDWARQPPELHGGSPFEVHGDAFALVGDVPLTVDGRAGRASATLRFGAGEEHWFALSLDRPDAAIAVFEIERHLGATIDAWRRWVNGHDAYDGAYRAEVGRSALVLQAMTYRPTGAIVAAPTTSLPEVLGGDANWDYRYAWLRDASITVEALIDVACRAEGRRYLDWMAEAAQGVDADHRLQILFAVDGGRELRECTLDHLAGYAGSRPVRVGNAAWRQQQHDVSGEVLRTAVLVADGEEFDAEDQAFLCELADRAAEHWREPDSGIWEGREGERHYVSSKVLSWCALDGAARLADRLGPRARRRRWRREADRVRADVLEHGWDEQLGTFTGAYGSDRLDASNLLMVVHGFLPANDLRMISTVDRIADELGEDGLIGRWSGDDDQGWFVICSCWLAVCLARRGQPDRARHVLERVLAHANGLGLLAEQINRSDGSLLGNFPQTFSHAGVIIAANCIDRAERGDRSSMVTE
jgi:GH15 family glucan-1,4-alpha-glucosidase